MFLSFIMIESLELLPNKTTGEIIHLYLKYFNKTSKEFEALKLNSKSGLNKPSKFNVLCDPDWSWAATEYIPIVRVKKHLLLNECLALAVNRYNHMQNNQTLKVKIPSTAKTVDIVLIGNYFIIKYFCTGCNYFYVPTHFKPDPF